MSMSAQQLQHEAEDSGLEQGDIIQDAKFFQDAAMEYQLAYQSLEEKYNHQVVLVKVASDALKASESCVSVMQEELMALQCIITKLISKRMLETQVSQYEHQLSTVQTYTHDQLAIVQLQEQVQVLQVSLASQRDLPSVGASQREVDLQEEVFNFIPGTWSTPTGVHCSLPFT